VTPETLSALGHYLTFLLVLFGLGLYLTLSEPALRPSQRIAIGVVIAAAWPWFAFRLLRRLFTYLARTA